MGWVMWFLINRCPGAISYFGPSLNSTVHAFMYGYYALTCERRPPTPCASADAPHRTARTSRLRRRCSPAALGYKPTWKMLMTTGQMVQFVLVMAQAVFHLLPANMDRYWPRSLTTISAVLMVQMLWMFGEFFATTF